MLPTKPSSSPAKAMKTMVFSNSYWLMMRASSMTAATPLPSSETPGAISEWFESANWASALALAGAAPPVGEPGLVWINAMES